MATMMLRLTLALVYRLQLLRRQEMDRRRLEEAFFQYALLKVAAWYKIKPLNELKMHSETCNTLAIVTPLFHNEFMKNYAGN